MFNNRLLLFLLIIVACREGDKKDYSVVPSVEFISITPESVNEGEKVTIQFRYTDGDGDLGENSPEAKNLFITDNRLAVTYSMRISELAPQGASVPITGKLNAEIPGLTITDNSSVQTVNYSLYITDRAGHLSNVITTSAVTIHQ